MPQHVTVVCPGWGINHGTLVLKQGPPDAPLSHTCCDRCAMFLEASDRLNPEALDEYRRYLEGVSDPRD